jgi:hypothetical protein
MARPSAFVRGPPWLTTGWILDLFAEDVELARQRLRAFVDGTRSP